MFRPFVNGEQEARLRTKEREAKRDVPTASAAKGSSRMESPWELDLAAMSVFAWSPEKRLSVMFYKILRWERRRGHSSAMIKLSPGPVAALALQPGETVVGEVTNRTGRRFRFGTTSIVIESESQWVRVSYDSIVVHHCMAERTDVPQDEARRKDYYRSLKKHYGDCIILVDRQGTRYELDGLDQAYLGVHHFFSWLVARRDTSVQHQGR